MQYSIINTGGGNGFEDGHALMQGASRSGGSENAVVIIGAQAGAAFRELRDAGKNVAVLIELHGECLGVHTGESRAEEGSNVLGFARFRLGTVAPTNLVEIVRQPRTRDAALAAAKTIFESAGLQVAVCGDFSGRIIDRLVRPYYNAALTRLDEGLATADDLDTTLKLGLGYPEGPISLLERTGIEYHFEVTQELFEAYGDAAYAPARRARVAHVRAVVRQQVQSAALFPVPSGNGD
jgi:3-hydroxybutyryl-CoA dehydrogenase